MGTVPQPTAESRGFWLALQLPLITGSSQTPAFRVHAMPSRISFAVFAACFYCALSASAQARDAQLADITRAVQTYSRYTVFDDVHAQVDAGAVTLTGKVTLPLKKDELGKRVAGLPGVTTVQNDIEVLARSPIDDDLRQRIARAIYGNSAFWRYAAMPTPPIRILVERGRVTLTGVVATDSDRMLARSLATGLGETSLVCDLRIDR